MIKKHIELLGTRVIDRVTDFEGVVTSMSFDLYGCIQAVVTPAGLDKEGKRRSGEWFDVSRLKPDPSYVTRDLRVMPVPDFAGSGIVAQGGKGPEPKPRS